MDPDQTAPTATETSKYSKMLYVKRLGTILSRE